MHVCVVSETQLVERGGVKVSGTWTSAGTEPLLRKQA